MSRLWANLHCKVCPAGGGEKQGRTDKATEAGLEPATAALKMINAINASKYEVYIGGKEILGVYLKRWFPKL
ncbi:MAG: hypothetical protein HKN61_08945 [Flavobacteriaceae bacterium]|nr:hypothetical protein [Flavobacteriaceae bacterium]